MPLNTSVSLPYCWGAISYTNNADENGKMVPDQLFLSHVLKTPVEPLLSELQPQQKQAQTGRNRGRSRCKHVLEHIKIEVEEEKENKEEAIFFYVGGASCSGT